MLTFIVWAAVGYLIGRLAWLIWQIPKERDL